MHHPRSASCSLVLPADCHWLNYRSNVVIKAPQSSCSSGDRLRKVFSASPSSDMARWPTVLLGDHPLSHPAKPGPSRVPGTLSCRSAAAAGGSLSSLIASSCGVDPSHRPTARAGGGRYCSGKVKCSVPKVSSGSLSPFCGGVLQSSSNCLWSSASLVPNCDSNVAK